MWVFLGGWVVQIMKQKFIRLTPEMSILLKRSRKPLSRKAAGGENAIPSENRT